MLLCEADFVCVTLRSMALTGEVVYTVVLSAFLFLSVPRKMSLGRRGVKGSLACEFSCSFPRTDQCSPYSTVCVREREREERLKGRLNTGSVALPSGLDQTLPGRVIYPSSPLPPLPAANWTSECCMCCRASLIDHLITPK